MRVKSGNTTGIMRVDESEFVDHDHSFVEGQKGS